MESKIDSPLQMREVFHLEFLRWFSRKVEAKRYALKGFKSIRYSEDMDIDVHGEGVERLKKIVMEILLSRGFLNNMRSFGVVKVVPPDLLKAKQTGTTQRFKVHLLTAAGEDLFTKIEFSRRGVKGKMIVDAVPPEILRSYKMAPLFVSHYDVASAIQQKIQALAQRSVLQARDIFDLFVLSSQFDGPPSSLKIGKDILKTAHDNIFLVEFPQFRDTVVAYLEPEDQKAYATAAVWDEIKLKTAHFLEEFQNANA